MKYRMLGKSGLLVSEIGFGCWGIGGDHQGAVAYGPTRDEDSLRALYSAFKRGVNFFDTSDFYGHGHSEYLLGKAFHALRSKVLIASKGGMSFAENTGKMPSSYLRTSLEHSLKRLRTDYLDLYQLHSPALQTLEQDPELFPLLEQLQLEGKIRAYGISVRTPADGLEVVRKYPCSCLQVNFSLFDQRGLENGLLEFCANRQVGVIGRTPLCFGYLTGHYTGNESFSGSDHRHRWSRSQVDKWVETQKKFLSFVSQNGNWTPTQFALRYCLSYEAVSTVIPGMLLESHVSENCGASDGGPLPSQVLEDIRSVYQQNRELLAIQQ